MVEVSTKDLHSIFHHYLRREAKGKDPGWGEFLNFLLSKVDEV